MNKQYQFITCVLLTLVAIGISGYTFFQRSKVGFVRSEKVFNEFRMTKELQAKYENIRNSRDVMLDSMVLELKMLETQAQRNKSAVPVFEYKREQYLRKRAEFEEQNETMTVDYDKQIWTRINQYTTDYGKAKQYDFIYGANGDGSVMYATEGKDITEEVLDYLNKKYEGK